MTTRKPTRLRLIGRFIRYELYAAGRCAQIFGQRQDERRWAREVEYYRGPSRGACPLEPIFSKGKWKPDVPVAPTKPAFAATSEPCRQTLAAVERHLEGAVLAFKGGKP